MQCQFTDTPCRYIKCPLWSEKRQACRFVEAVDKVLDLIGDTERPPTNLSRRELQILNLIAQGYTNPQIGHALSITTQTTKNHVSNILLKLGAKNRMEAGLMAHKGPMTSIH